MSKKVFIVIETAGQPGRAQLIGILRGINAGRLDWEIDIVPSRRKASTTTVKRALSARADGVILAHPVGPGVPEQLQQEGKPTVFMDVLSPSDIQSRYGKYGYKFPENFIRHDKTQIKSSDDIIRDLSANVAQASRGDELFAEIDNIRKAMEITCAQSVKPFLNSLEAIIERAKAKGVTLTVLIVNHPTKDFKPGDSLELGDAAGSTELYNYLNYAFVIEPTKFSKQHKILKELSLRGETEPETVAIIKLENEAPYVHPVVLCEMDEKKALSFDKTQFEAFLQCKTVGPTSTGKEDSRTGLTHEDELEIYRLLPFETLLPGWRKRRHSKGSKERKPHHLYPSSSSRGSTGPLFLYFCADNQKR